MSSYLVGLGVGVLSTYLVMHTGNVGAWIIGLGLCLLGAVIADSGE